MFDLVIPARDATQNVRQILLCLVGQRGFGQIEHIVVVDDGSQKPMEKGDLLGDLGMNTETVNEKLSLITHRISKGSYAARNTGASLCGAPWIAFLDADCVPDENWIEAYVDVIRRRKPDICAGAVEFFASENVLTGWGRYDAYRNLKQERNVQNGKMVTANVLVSRSIYFRLDGFREWQSGADVEFGERATALGTKIQYSAGARVFHPVRNNSTQLLRKMRRVGRGMAERASTKGSSARLTTALFGVTGMFGLNLLANLVRDRSMVRFRDIGPFIIAEAVVFSTLLAHLTMRMNRKRGRKA